MNLLDIKNLSLELETPQGKVVAIDKASFNLREGEIHGLMGESGSGKSLIAKTIVGIINRRWTVKADRLYWDNKDLQSLSEYQRREIMSKDMAFIPQDAVSSLDPTSKIANQIEEIIPGNSLLLSPEKRKKRQQNIVRLLHQVGIKEHAQCLDSYPHELTDDECQKLVVAMALAKKPKLLIADEPGNRMEAISQQKIFKLLNKHNVVNNMSILLISHDIAMLAKFANRITVMYCGQMVESGNAESVYEYPMHPYSHALVNTNITLDSDLDSKSALPTLHGTIPTLQHLPIGCRLGPRCPNAQKECVKTPQAHKRRGHTVSCHFPVQHKGRK